ncbi:MAG: hypothetical protein WCK67_13585 [bacterium]
MINSTNFQFKPIETQTAQQPAAFAYENNEISATEKNMSEFVENIKKSQNIYNLSNDKLVLVTQPPTKETATSKKEEPKFNIVKWGAVTAGIVAVAALAVYKKDAILKLFKKAEKIVPKEPEKMPKINLTKEPIIADDEAKTLVETINNSKKVKNEAQELLENYKTTLKEAQSKTKEKMKEFFKNLTPEGKKEFARLSREENEIVRELRHKSPEKIKAYKALTKEQVTEITRLENELEQVRMKKLSLVHGQANVRFDADGVPCVNDLQLESSLQDHKTKAKKYLLDNNVYDGVKSVKKDKRRHINTIARCNEEIKEAELKLKAKEKNP